LVAGRPACPEPCNGTARGSGPHRMHRPQLLVSLRALTMDGLGAGR
jgi:hypothetical protein